MGVVFGVAEKPVKIVHAALVPNMLEDVSAIVNFTFGCPDVIEIAFPKSVGTQDAACFLSHGLRYNELQSTGTSGKDKRGKIRKT